MSFEAGKDSQQGTGSGGSSDQKSNAGWEDRLHDAGNRMEEELRRVIAYINDEVVPEVRRNGSDALRAASQQMEKLAQKMDERSRTSSTSDKSGTSGGSGPKDGSK
jgi:predicted phage gp36 major capsid-like protein